MKQTTKQISDLINNEHFSNLEKLIEYTNNNNWSNTEYQEVTFNEAYNDLNYLIDLLLKIISSDLEKFEAISTFQERNSILSNLNNLNSYIINIKGGNQGHINNFIQHIGTLKELIKKINLEGEIKGYPTYQKKLKDINYLKTKYENLIIELNKGKGLFDKLSEILNSANGINDKIKELNTNISEKNNQINSVKDDIDKRYENIKISNQNILELETTSTQHKEGIEEFFNKINDFREKIDKGIKDIGTNINENNKKTEEIITENEKIQKEIIDILGKAVGTNLYKSFNEKVKSMKKQLWFWLIVIGGSIYYLGDTGIYIFNELKPFFETGKIESLSLTFYLRLTIIFPAIYLVYFSTSQFNNTNKLLEEYEFKSAVAVALHYFKDLVEKSKDNEETQSFLINAINNIFKSPTENVFGIRKDPKNIEKKAKEIIDDIVDISSKILPKNN